METKSETLHRYMSVCVLVSLCYLCDGRWVDRNTDTDMVAKLISNKSRNASSQTGELALYGIRTCANILSAFENYNARI